MANLQAQTGAGSPDRTALGIGIILASVLGMAFADAMVKFASSDVTIWQIFFARSLVAVPILWVLLKVSGGGRGMKAPKWVILRSLLLVLCWLALYASLPVLDLSVAAVAVYTNPIMIVLLSALVLRERVTGRQWGGVFLGFLGVITILKPGTDAFSWFTLLPLLAAALYAVSMVLTRSKCRDESSMTLSLGLHVGFVVTGLLATGVLALIGLDAETQAIYPFVLGSWAPMDGRIWGLMALLGVLSAVYFMGVARAYQIAPPSTIATFDYAYLVWAALWDFVIFSRQPDLFTVGGMVLITAAGLLVAAPPRRRMA